MELLPKLYEGVTDTLYDTFYHGHYPPNLNMFLVNALSTRNNALYKVIIDCILPITT